MIWWWVGNAVLAVVVIPVVALLALRVLHPLWEIQAYADDIAEHGRAVRRELGGAEELARTRDLADAGRRAAERIAATKAT